MYFWCVGSLRRFFVRQFAVYQVVAEWASAYSCHVVFLFFLLWFSKLLFMCFSIVQGSSLWICVRDIQWRRKFEQGHVSRNASSAHHGKKVPFSSPPCSFLVFFFMCVLSSPSPLSLSFPSFLSPSLPFSPSLSFYLSLSLSTTLLQSEKSQACYQQGSSW